MVDTPMTRERLLDLIGMERAALEDLVPELSEEQMTTPGVVGEWTVKQVLAHVAGWERLLLSWLDMTVRGETPEGYAPGYPIGEEGMHRLNADMVAETASRPLADVLTEFHKTRGRVLAGVGSLTDEQINRPGAAPWTGDRPLLPFIAGNTYEHYREHAAEIRAWLDRACAT